MNNFVEIDAMSGVWVRNCDIYSDDRGYFFEELRSSSLPIGVPEFIQDSISFSKANVLRGMHMQENQWQLVTVLTGEILDVLINLDSKCVDYRKTTSIRMNWRSLNQILISPGIAHGYAVLDEEVRIHYKSSIYYGDSRQVGVNWQSKELIGYWPKRNWTISERDMKFPHV